MAPIAPGKRAQAKEQNRRIILKAARRVFAELGYDATNVRDIIRATPLATGTFYNYFRSKEEVFGALRDEAALAARPILRDARSTAETPESFVFAIFRSLFEYVAANRAEFVSIGWDKANGRVDTPEIVAGIDELRQDIEAAIGRGFFPPINAGWLAAAMLGVAFQLAESLPQRDLGDSDDAARFATALFMGGIAALPKAANGHANGAG